MVTTTEIDENFANLIADRSYLSKAGSTGRDKTVICNVTLTGETTNDDGEVDIDYSGQRAISRIYSCNIIRQPYNLTPYHIEAVPDYNNKTLKFVFYEPVGGFPVTSVIADSTYQVEIRGV